LEGDGGVSLIVPIEGSPNEFVIARGRSLWKLLWDASKGEEHSLEVTDLAFEFWLLFGDIF
jgi:hypothetical protein